VGRGRSAEDEVGIRGTLDSTYSAQVASSEHGPTLGSLKLKTPRSNTGELVYYSFYTCFVFRQRCDN
jgi:hypothetical protein